MKPTPHIAPRIRDATWRRCNECDEPVALLAADTSVSVAVCRWCVEQRGLEALGFDITNPPKRTP